MYNKKIICLDDGRLIAIKFCEETNLCIIGGQESMREQFIAVMVDYFGFTEDNVPEFRTTTKTKGKYVFSTTWEAYMKAISQLRNDNFTVRDVRTHGKLMR